MNQQQIELILKNLESRKGQHRIPAKKKVQENFIRIIQPNPEDRTKPKHKPGKLYVQKIRPVNSHRSYTNIDELDTIYSYHSDPFESDMPIKLPKIQQKNKVTKFYRARHKSNTKEHYRMPTAASRIYVIQNQLAKKKSYHRICSVHCNHLEKKQRPKRGSRSQNYLTTDKDKYSQKKNIKRKRQKSVETVQQYPQDQNEVKYPQKQLKKYLESTQIKNLFSNEHQSVEFTTYFGLQPQFYKLQTEYVHQIYEQHLKKGIEETNKIIKHHDIPQIPKRDKLLQFIKGYKPYDKKINISQMMKCDNFYVEYSEQQLYFGQRSAYQRQGIGILLTQKSLFEGLFSNGYKTKGIEITNSGIYRGQFYLNKRQGKGQFEGINHQFYIGDWKNGHRHGNGVWTNGKGDSFNGQWVKGKCYGQGIYITYGKQYHGDFYNFKKDGWGRQSWSNGDKYQGGFKQGLPEGKGVYNWANGTKYEGEFVKGFRHGIGIVSTLDGFTYKGQFCDEKPEGCCELITPNGDNYKGNFRNGKKNGRGVLTLSTRNKILNGYWQNDRFLLKIPS